MVSDEAASVAGVGVWTALVMGVLAALVLWW
jgi:hypothetical protein